MLSDLIKQKQDLQTEIIRLPKTDPLRANKLQSLNEIIKQIDNFHRPKKIDKDLK